MATACPAAGAGNGRKACRGLALPFEPDGGGLRAGSPAGLTSSDHPQAVSVAPTVLYGKGIPVVGCWAEWNLPLLPPAFEGGLVRCWADGGVLLGGGRLEGSE